MKDKQASVIITFPRDLVSEGQKNGLKEFLTPILKNM